MNVKNIIVPATTGIILFIVSPHFLAHASPTPPMGFNSYDCLNFSATEAEMKAITDTIAKKYLQYGWQYVCIDWCWSFPGMGTQGSPNQSWNGTEGNPTAATRLTMDEYGRLMPDTVRHPSSAGGKGFKPLADYIHSKGMKFGIHVMRGIPRQAVYQNTPIYGTSYRAADAADKRETCAWLNHMYGLNFNSPAAQAYLHSIVAMYADWGVDYLKIDDLMNSLVNPRTSFKKYIQGYREAIDSTHRDIVLSTSPGATPIGDSVFLMNYANQWRMADDLWDNWNTLNAMIDLFTKWYSCAYAPHFPDADMIPIGRLSKRGPVGQERWSNLTHNEQYTLMTMWSIGRSPLLWGGDVRDNRPVEDSLMTNAEVVRVNQRGAHPRPVIASAARVVWVSEDADSSDVKYVAMVNRTAGEATVTLSFDKLGMSSCSVRNLWMKKDLGVFTASFSQSLAGHASGLFKLTPPPTAIRSTALSTPSVTGRPVHRCVVPGCGMTARHLKPVADGTVRMYDITGKLIRISVTSDMNEMLRAISTSGVYLLRYHYTQ